MKLQITLMAILALGACKDDKDKKGEAPAAGKSGAADKGAAPAPEKAAAGPLKLEKFGLSIEAPAGTKVSAMGDSMMLQGPGLVLTVGVAGEYSAENLAAEVEDATSSYSATNLTQAEVEGGWDVTFENKGGMGTNYWVKVRRTFDDKQYECSTTASSKEQQDAALTACKTLKK